jgi:hypothetical protein
MTTILLLPLLAMMAVCQDKAEPVPFTIRAKGTSGGFGDPVEKVVASKKEWAEAWPRTPVPDIDFDKDVALVVSFGTKPTSGYSVEITRVEKTAEEIRVIVRRTVPPKGSKQLTVLTQPFVVARMAKPDRKVVFVEEKD